MAIGTKKISVQDISSSFTTLYAMERYETVKAVWFLQIVYAYIETPVKVQYYLAVGPR